MSATRHDSPLHRAFRRIGECSARAYDEADHTRLAPSVTAISRTGRPTGILQSVRVT